MLPPAQFLLDAESGGPGRPILRRTEVRSGFHHRRLDDAVIALDGLDDLDVGIGDALAEDRVHTVEVAGGAAIADEELAAAGVLAGMGHGHGAQLVLVGVARRLALDLPAWAAGAGHARGAGLGVGAAALDDELGDD